MKTLPRLLVLASLILPLGAFAAGAAALAECRKQGNKNCKVAVRFDSCGAYASSRKNSGIGYGKSVDVARTMAMNECGTKACKIVVAECE